MQPQLTQDNDRLGIALDTLEQMPINGMRVPGLSGTSDWFIYGNAEPSDDVKFYSPLCVKHIRKHFEITIPYLCLPAGWRFQIDQDGYEDVWYDETLLKSIS
ncbi:MAG TPA: hypothetical protein DDW52_23245 [Planctomycetaceae bacterium]|nr:hypothetical protein [Planctomycetaceae bacterium]